MQRSLLALEMYLPYSGYFSWGKIFTEGRSVVLGKIFIPGMLTTDIFVKLCSIMDALISGMQSRLTSGSGLAHARLGVLTVAG